MADPGRLARDSASHANALVANPFDDTEEWGSRPPPSAGPPVTCRAGPRPPQAPRPSFPAGDQTCRPVNPPPVPRWSPYPAGASPSARPTGGSSRSGPGTRTRTPSSAGSPAPSPAPKSAGRSGPSTPPDA
nr:hypothetical protein [Streptomyces griseomycini]